MAKKLPTKERIVRERDTQRLCRNIEALCDEQGIPYSTRQNGGSHLIYEFHGRGSQSIPKSRKEQRVGTFNSILRGLRNMGILVLILIAAMVILAMFV